MPAPHLTPESKRRFLFLVPAITCLLCAGALPLKAAIFTVTSAADSGPGSLREAITSANATTGPDLIQFAIPGSGARTISLLTALPSITEPLIIDGTTQPGYVDKPLVELNGAGCVTGPGLHLVAGQSTVRALIINRFPAEGIRLEGPGTNHVKANFIGTDTTGALPRGNGQQGIIVYGSDGNVIGGTSAAERNLVSGNKDVGVYLFNSSGNVVQGNFVGTTWNGTGGLGNTNHGLVLYNSPGNVVGGPTPGARNVISGNKGSGVYLFGQATSGNRVEGNFIGTDASGSLAIGNRDDGISFFFAPGNSVGGTNSGAGNLVSGNGFSGMALEGEASAYNLIQGNLVGTSAAGNSRLPNSLAGITFSAGARSNSVGGTAAAARNIISGNKQDGIFLTGNSAGNSVFGNFIGLNASGTAMLSNGFNGITLNQSYSNFIGSDIAVARNVISGNGYYGVHLVSGASGNTIAGNFVGTDHTGAASVSNRLSGIRIDAPLNLIGGTTSGSGNVISGNGEDGIYIVGAAAVSNRVAGNFIGTVSGGTAALGNQRGGIGISGAPRNLIGGIDPFAGNTISANRNSGIYLLERASAWNEILGNRIGTDLAGKLDLGNAFDGINCYGAVSNTIGSEIAGGGNQISGNNNGGVYMFQSSWNLIQGNLVGTKADGTSPLGNSMSGVECDLGATNNIIGGSPEGANRIAFNQTPYAGVRIRPGATRNLVACNSIFSNGALGIDLGSSAGVTPNDACDSDGGANGQQNFPLLLDVITGSGTRIRGTLNSTASRTFRVQFFANVTADSSGYGEGELYLGETSVSTAANCTASFTAWLPGSVPPNTLVTATATDPFNNTSEFAACIPVTTAPQLQLTSSPAEIVLSWPNSPAGFVLNQTGSLTPPVLWTAVTSAPISVGGSWVLALPVSSATNLFFTLVLE